VFHLLLTLPPEYRWSEDLPRDILGTRWPELLEFPLNQAMGVKRGLQISKNLLRSMARQLIRWGSHVPAASRMGATGGLDKTRRTRAGKTPWWRWVNKETIA
jgi:hypothetical protein